MQCKFCGAQWTLAKGMTMRGTQCPFCGKTLTPEKTLPPAGIAEAFSLIARNYGVEILRDRKKAVPYFMDLAPSLRRELKLVEEFYQCDGSPTLFGALSLSLEEQAKRRQLIIQRMVDECYLNERASELVCVAFWNAICEESQVITVSGQQPKTAAKEHAPEPPPKPPFQRSDSPPKTALPDFQKKYRQFFFGVFNPEELYRLSTSSAPEDKFELGMRYLYGYCAPYDISQGIQLLDSLSRQGHHIATKELLVYYASVNENYGWILRHGRMAVADGYYPACAALGLFYSDPHTPPHFRSALVSAKLFLLGAHHGDPDSTYYCAFDQTDTTQNQQEPHVSIISEAARLGSAQAYVHLAEFAVKKDGNMSAASAYALSAFQRDPTKGHCLGLYLARKSYVGPDLGTQLGRALGSGFAPIGWNVEFCHFGPPWADPTIMLGLAVWAISAKYGSEDCAFTLLVNLVNLIHHEKYRAKLEKQPEYIEAMYLTVLRCIHPYLEKQRIPLHDAKKQRRLNLAERLLMFYSECPIPKNLMPRSLGVSLRTLNTENTNQCLAAITKLKTELGR